MAKESKIKSNSELDDIKQDLNSLKSNVVALTKTMQEDGKKRASAASARAQESLSALQERSKENMEKVDEKIREKPTQSMLAAFGAGFVLSMLLSRRG